VVSAPREERRGTSWRHRSRVEGGAKPMKNIEPKEKGASTDAGGPAVEKTEVHHESIQNATRMEMFSEVLEVKKEVVKTELDITPAEYTPSEFTAADFKAAEFKQATFTPAKFEQASFKEASFKPAEFKAAEFKPAEFKQGHYQPAEFKPAVYKPAEFKAAEFKPAEFKPAEFKPAEFKEASFKPAEYRPAEYKPAEYKAAEYQPASFTAAQYKEASFKPAEFKQAEYKSAEFKPAEIESKIIEERPVEVLRTMVPHVVETQRAVPAAVRTGGAGASPNLAGAMVVQASGAAASWSTAELERLDEYLRQEMNAVKTYDLALERSRDHAIKRSLAELRDNHERRVGRLREVIRAAGVEPARVSVVWSAVSRLIHRGESIGDRSLLSALLEEEDHGLELYSQDPGSTTPQIAEYVGRHLLPEQRRTQETCRALSKPRAA
jgi:uncharacterized protein YjbI with pentapeptide repeats